MNNSKRIINRLKYIHYLNASIVGLDKFNDIMDDVKKLFNEKHLCGPYGYTAVFDDTKSGKIAMKYFVKYIKINKFKYTTTKPTKERCHYKITVWFSVF